MKSVLIIGVFVCAVSWLGDTGYAAYRSNRIYLTVRDSSCNEALFLPGLQKLDSLVAGRRYNRAYYEVIVAADKSGCYVVNFNPAGSGLHIKTGSSWTDHLEATPEALQRAVRAQWSLPEIRHRFKPLPPPIADVFQTSQ